MIPFHLIYSFLFKSFNIKSESETIEHLRDEGVTSVIIIKRSWIFALKMIWIPILIGCIASINIYIALAYFTDAGLKNTLLIGVGISVVLFLFSVISYLLHFRKIYAAPKIENDLNKLLENLKEWDASFIRFFDQTILNQWIIIGLIICGIYFYIGHTMLSWDWITLVDSGLLFCQWILLWHYRKRMMDLEMDYNIVVPGKVIFVNQSGLLSSTYIVESEKIKTIRSSFPSWIASFFHYGTIEIMTEGDSSVMQGTMPMYYVTNPDETVQFIQEIVNPDKIQERRNMMQNSNIRKDEITPEEVSYDVKWTVRDVLR